HHDPISRDGWMFEYLREQLDSLNTGKAILWAHNVHILRDTVAVGAKGLGYFLHRQYGDAYYALGFDSYEGTVSTIRDNAFESHDFRLDANTISARLAGMGYDRLFLSFRADRT